MCLAVPGKVKKIGGLKAEVEYSVGEELQGVVREVLVGEEKVRVGDWVMVQMGIIVRVLSEKEARERRRVWGEAW